MGGREVIDILRGNEDFNNIQIIVHTNMSNDVMNTSLLDAGANEIIGKVNMLALGEAIVKLMR